MTALKRSILYNTKNLLVHTNPRALWKSPSLLQAKYLTSATCCTGVASSAKITFTYSYLTCHVFFCTLYSFCKHSIFCIFCIKTSTLFYFHYYILYYLHNILYFVLFTHLLIVYYILFL